MSENLEGCSFSTTLANGNKNNGAQTIKSSSPPRNYDPKSHPVGVG